MTESLDQVSGARPVRVHSADCAVSRADRYDFYHYNMDPELSEEIRRFADEKKKRTMCVTDEDRWREAIKQELEDELNRRVHEALGPPVSDKPEQTDSHNRKKSAEKSRDLESLEQLNAHLNLSARERDSMHSRRWKLMQAKKNFQRIMSTGRLSLRPDFDENGYPMNDGFFGTDDVESLKEDEYENLVSTFTRRSSVDSTSQNAKSQDFYAKLASKAFNDYGNLSPSERYEFFYMFTKNGFKEALRTGRLPDGTEIEVLENGKCRDRFGIIRDSHGPFWPPDFGPLFPAPTHNRELIRRIDPLVSNDVPVKHITTETNALNNKYAGKWRGVTIVFDSEKTSRDYIPRPVSELLCPSLAFESRFESGNLRQARRIGAFEYELVLRTDLYTSRHTQWFYFRVKDAVPGVTYKFKIINLHKRDSLYNHGMRPLVYSDKNAQMKNIGWERTGHHIVYTRNTTNLQCPLLARDRNYYTLEWQMEFPNGNDVCYMAHCYPYTFTDLRDDLDYLLADSERSQVMKRQVMCETRAGNSCFLITVTNFSNEECKKKVVVITARVHPGETNSSWMMKGVLDYITGNSPVAKQLRNRFIFKIVPMLNPDGVIVGNYRCSLAGRDLNRNYRHPRKESFPTVWNTKAMMEEVGRWNDILLYCDLHGHSRKHNVFMYGCNQGSNQIQGTPILPEIYLNERLFPWLMSQKAPDKFWFRSCKFQVKKCKESTGRVVVFRQLKISNSFTMEATFCGTTICRGERRHFNSLDFQDMGHTLCEVVLDYHQVQDNKARQSEVILDLTRAITQQILETRGLLPPNLPDFTTERGREQLKVFSDEQIPGSDQVAQAFITMIKKDRSRVQSATGSTAASDHGDEENTNQPPDFSKMDIHQLLDTMSSQTIDGCAQLLEQLHVADTMNESDSSDSDSESEPEMKYVETKIRRRKKKKKKRGHSDSDKSKVADSSVGESQTGFSDRTKTAEAANGLPAIEGEGANRRKQSISMSKYVKNCSKTYPAYVNKYKCRSNGGIPCFSEERLLERAHRRMQEMKTSLENEHRDPAYYPTVEEDVLAMAAGGGGLDQLSGPFHKLHRNNDLQRQFHQILSQGPVGGLAPGPGNPGHARIGYSHNSQHTGHGDYPHLHSLVEGTSVQLTPSNGMGTQADIADSSSDSDDELEELPKQSSLTSLRSPYHHLNSNNNNQTQHSATAHPMHRRLGRLPTLNHKPAPIDRCSIPLRHSMPTNMVVTSLQPRSDRPDGAAPTLEPSLSAGHRPQSRKLSVTKVGETLQPSDGAGPGHQGALGLMSREYSDLLMNRLRGQKMQSYSALS